MRLKGILAVAVTASLVAAASAQLTAYNNQAAWEADLITGGFTPQTEGFDGLNIGPINPADGLVPVNSDFGIRTEGQFDADDGVIANGEFDGAIFPNSGHSAYVHEFNTPVVGFGQFYFGAASGLGLRIETTEGTIDIFDDGGYSGFADGFLGFISVNPITSVRVIGSDADGGSAVGEIYQADDVSYAFVPEPTSLTLLALAGLGLIRRR